MSLILPDFGLLFWTGITFCLLLFILAKFVWKPILNAVNARGQKIEEALLEAEKARQEMKALHAENERILKEARAERDVILMEAKSTSLAMIEEAKNKSKLEGVKMIEAAKKSIEQEKNAAIAEMKSTVANFSIDIAEKLVKETLSSDAKQKQLADQLAEELNFN